MNIADYFSSIERSLKQYSSVTSIEIIEVLASDDFNGILRCRIHFWDDTFLSIHETVSTELGHPVRIVYSYSYVRRLLPEPQDKKSASNVPLLWLLD